MEIQFGPWLPDQIDYKNPGLEVCENVIPAATGYVPARDTVSSGLSVPGVVIGGAATFLNDGTPLRVVATTADLYVIRNDTVTPSGLGLGLAETAHFSFQQYGAAIYATAQGGGTYVLPDIETSAEFETASGSPPDGMALARVADFLVMGNLIDIDGSNAPFRIRWSGFNDPGGDWVTNIGRQAGFVDLNSALGPVTAMTGGTSGLIFQRQGVSRLEYTGGASVFSLTTFEQNRGCVAPASAVQVGGTTYYLANDGFFATDGTSPRPISAGRVWDWFLENSNRAFIPSVAGAVDFQSRCIVWLYVKKTSQTRVFGGQLRFNWETGNWSHVDMAIQWALPSVKGGLTLEGLAALYPSLDDVPLSLDSPEYQPSGLSLQVLRGGELCSLTGPTLAARFGSGEMQPFDGRRTIVQEVAPLVKSADASVIVGTRDSIAAPIWETPPVPVGPAGFAPFNSDGRMFQVSIILGAGTDWRDASGFRVTARPSGAT